MVVVGSAIFAELDLERDLARSTQPPDVLSDQPLGRRDRVVAPVHGGPLLEVEMDRMIPTSAAVDIGPVFDLAGFRNQWRDAVGVHRMRRLSDDPDGARE